MLAVAGGQVIMLSDVMAALDLGLVSDDGAADRVGAALAKLINRGLMLVEANRYAPPEPGDDAVEREMAGVRGRFPSAAAFDAVSSALGPHRGAAARDAAREPAHPRLHRAAICRIAKTTPGD